jgi:MSHA biogenesis protein MshN
MSLINKMLQDLDARSTQAGEALPGQVKPVGREPHRVNLRVVGACAGGVAAGMALVWFGVSQYRHQQRPAARAGPVTMATPTAAATGAVATGPTALPAAAAPAALPGTAAAATAAPTAPTSAAPAAPLAAASVVMPAAAAPSVPPAPAAARAQVIAPAAADASQTIAPLEPDSVEARAARVALARALEARSDAHPRSHKPAPAAAPTAAGDDEASASSGMGPAQGRHADGRQRAEAEYRRALASLQEGRMLETFAALEAALRFEPAHGAARQTLVGLLVEAGRHDDAMRQAQAGLTLDPRQSALAMLLARLQMEHGGNGIDTLTRTLPYAGDNADFRAFLAAALERQGRHREAAEQYGAALRLAPSNGVWWMGLGMALQADKRDGEALDAFQKARASGMPSQELQEFVERRLAQLRR